MKFRADVDGLRGVAVLLVVVYHTKLGLMPGGYVGVDVFFVISGFVITGLIVSLIDRGQFSTASFLARRLRRLMPAAAVVVAATLLAGCFILGPRDLRTLAGSSIAVIGFVPNFYFWGRQGYFADQVPEHPLLHTWSLGVEQQFYLVFPPLLLAIAAVKPRSRPAAFALVALVLFIFGGWLTGVHPGAAFYLLPARGWEFLVGGLVALLGSRSAAHVGWRTGVGLAGLAGIFIAAVGITPATPYPGVAALLPVLSTAGVIWADGQGPTRSGRLLGTRWLVAVGGMSYSIYLWHWPVLTLARYYQGRGLTQLETVYALCAVALLSFASWKWVERPFRAGADSNTLRRSFRPIFALEVSVLAVAVAVLAGGGFPARLPAAALAFDAAAPRDGADNGKCHRGPPAAGSLCRLVQPWPGHAHLLVWGDSHANALVPALAELGRRHGVGVTQATYSSCPPFLDAGVAHVRGSTYCREFNQQVLGSIKERGITRVLLAGYWTTYFPSRAEPLLSRLLDPYSGAHDLAGGNAAQNERAFSAALGRTLHTLESLGVEVWILRQVPDQNVLVPLALSRAAARGQEYEDLGVTSAEYRRKQARVDLLFDMYGSSAHLVDPAELLCSSGICRCSAGGQALYIDANHLSPTGAGLLKPLLEGMFR